MNKFRYKMFQFMQGRRGLDQFSRFLLMVSALFFLISIFWFNSITYPLAMTIAIYANFRAFSKNLYKREQENNWFLAQKYKFTGGRTFGRTGQSAYGYNRPSYDMQNYVYFKCPACGQKLRAPRGKGKIMIKCQHCSNQFEKKV